MIYQRDGYEYQIEMMENMIKKLYIEVELDVVIDDIVIWRTYGKRFGNMSMSRRGK
jgi:hypothetical protein